MKIKSALLVSCLLGLSSYALAGSETGTLGVKLTVAGTCSVTAGTSGVFGDIDFGTVSGATGAIDSSATGTAAVSCSKNYPYTVAVDAGANAEGNQRRLINTDGATIDYNLFQDSTQSDAWVPGTAVSFNGTGSAESLAFFARVPDANAAVGEYTDTVNVTIAW